MKIVVDEESAYVHLEGNKFIKIGEKREVARATPTRQAELFWIAMSFAEYNGIQTSKGQTAH